MIGSQTICGNEKKTEVWRNVICDASLPKAIDKEKLKKKKKQQQKLEFGVFGRSHTWPSPCFWNLGCFLSNVLHIISQEIKKRWGNTRKKFFNFYEKDLAKVYHSNNPEAK